MRRAALAAVLAASLGCAEAARLAPPPMTTNAFPDGRQDGAASAAPEREVLALPGVAESTRIASGLFATLATDKGEMVFRLLPESAPMAVENFVGLATGKKSWTDPRTGKRTTRRLYDGTAFFRVIPGFIIQGGDPLGDGSGGPGFTFGDELRSGRVFDKAGLLAMASPAPDSNGSQFFVTLGPAPWLNRKHTIFGELGSGLAVAEAIAAAPRVRTDPVSGLLVDRPVEPQALREVRIGEKP
ncbi:MAG: peptidylprolyl isomerase [Elusimicrobiota bacterium]